MNHPGVLMIADQMTRSKGLDEITAREFKDFIRETIHFDPVNIHHVTSSDELP